METYKEKKERISLENIEINEHIKSYFKFNGY